MKHPIFAGTAVAALVASSAYAEDFTHNVGLQATVPATCKITNPPTVTQGGEYVSVSGTEASTFVVPVNSDTKLAESVTGELTFANSICNSPSTLSMTRTPFETSAPILDGFGNFIPYRVRVSWGDLEIGQTDMDGTDSFTMPLSPRVGDLALTIEVVGEGSPLTPGQYTGTVSMTLSPGV